MKRIVGIILFFMTMLLNGEEYQFKTMPEVLDIGFYSNYDQEEISQEYYLAAMDLYNSKKYSEALREFEKAISLYSSPLYYYNYANCLADIKDYSNSEKAYLKTLSIFGPDNSYPLPEFIAYDYNTNPDKKYTNGLYSFDSNNNVRERYFAHYNLACLYSIQNEYEKAMEKIKDAIEMGYPYMNHILNDPDLKNIYNFFPDIKSTIESLYEEISKNKIAGRKFEHRESLTYQWRSASFNYHFIDDRNVIAEAGFDLDYRHPKFYGTYEIKNNYVLISFHLVQGFGIAYEGEEEVVDTIDESISRRINLSLKDMLNSERDSYNEIWREERVR